jgi:hypothetical protein
MGAYFHTLSPHGNQPGNFAGYGTARDCIAAHDLKSIPLVVISAAEVPYAGL